ncbi:MAG: complex I NDUFA9 subunit family protein [Pseudomonadota bacterium]
MSKLVTLFGGGGFIGRHTVRAFAQKGYRVRVAVRRPDLAGHLQPTGAVGQIHAVQANIRYPKSVEAAVEGADTVVNLVAVLQSRGKQSFDNLHVEGAKTVATAVKAAGAQSFVQISGLGASETSASDYARTKAVGERAVLQAFPEAIILRPSVVFGPEDDFFNRFAGMARISPVLPLVGGGATKFQPVYVGDVADAIVNAAEGVGTPGMTYELGGPEVLSFRECIDRVQQYTGRDRAYVSLPFWAAKIQARLMSILPNAPLTPDQVRLLKTDSIVSETAQEDGRTLAALGVEAPRFIDAIVPQYLERFSAKGQYTHYRSS